MWLFNVVIRSLRESCVAHICSNVSARSDLQPPHEPTKHKACLKDRGEWRANIEKDNRCSMHRAQWQVPSRDVHGLDSCYTYINASAAYMSA